MVVLFLGLFCTIEPLIRGLFVYRSEWLFRTLRELNWSLKAV